MGLEERLVYYWARLYSGQLGPGDPHSDLRPVVGVYFLDFVRLPTERLHSRFHIREDHEGFALSNALELHFLQLPKLPPLPGSAETHRGDLAEKVVQWRRFLAAQSDDELEILSMTDPDLRDAKRALDDLSADPKARELAQDRAVWRWVYEKEVAHRRAEGLREGLISTIRTVCRFLDIELSTERRQSLEAMAASDLEALLAAIERDKRWPS